MSIDRRQFAKGTGALALAGGTGALTLGMTATDAFAQDATPTPAWEQAVARILNGAQPVQAPAAKVLLDVPEIAENGNTVPFTISVESPMTEQDFVKSLHVVSTGNPQPGIVNFHLTPDTGKAAVSSRMRLGRTQDIILIVEMGDGRFLMTKRNVKVTIGGCGG